MNETHIKLKSRVRVGVTSLAAALPMVSLGDFRQPVYVSGPHSQPRAAYVLERGGRVWRVAPSGRRRLFLDARAYVRLPAPRAHMTDQTGAFALAFPPRYRPGGSVYLLYTRRDGRVHLDAFGHRRRPRTVLSVRQTSSVDVAGDLAFGPGGRLYAGFGYGGDPAASQDPGTIAGKVVSVNTRARVARPRIVASGLRVPWRMTVDRRRRRLVVADVGESRFEEVDLVPLAGPAPDLGWPFFEGFARRMAGGPPEAGAPALAIRHRANRMCAIVGGHLRRGRYLYGDVCSGRVYSARLGAERARDNRFEHTVVPYLVSFGRDGAGRLYAVSVLGRVYRFG
jgi:glucose/arabinose dehydrogenase